MLLGILHHLLSSMPRILRYRLQTIGGSIDALVDSGAELSLISASAVKKRGIQTDMLMNPSILY